MPAERILPSDSQLIKWREQGLTHAQIAQRASEQVGRPISAGAVMTALSRAGHTNRVRFDYEIPWTTSKRHTAVREAQMLRAWARERRGLPMSDKLRTRYENWKQSLEEANAVVWYDRDAYDEAAGVDGYCWVARTDLDAPGDLVRRPEVQKQLLARQAPASV